MSNENGPKTPRIALKNPDDARRLIRRVLAEIFGQQAELAEMHSNALEVAGFLAEKAGVDDLLKHIETMQPNAINIIRKHGFIFKTSLPTVFENPEGQKSSEEWEKLAFTFYSDVCDLDSRARQLKEDIENNSK
jgi:hypothetical protein